MTVVRRVLTLGLFVALLASGWSFAAGNEQTIAVHYLLGTTEQVPVWLVVGVAWTSGVALAGLYLGLALLKDRVEIRRLHRAIHRLEDELSDFRNKPVGNALAVVEADEVPDAPARSDVAGGGR